MYLIAAVLLAALASAVIIKLYFVFRNQVEFYSLGKTQGFSSSELSELWKAAEMCPFRPQGNMFREKEALGTCITLLKAQAELSGDTNSEDHQQMLSKLYRLRTELEQDDAHKRGISTTYVLGEGQKLCVILPGKGVFVSEIIRNAKDMMIQMPTQKGSATVPVNSWLGKDVNVYFWRKNDAGYVFETTVINAGSYMGKPVLHIANAEQLSRMQKRNAVRVKCSIAASLYILTEPVVDYNKIESKDGYKCVLEDISEKGALIRIGGKGIPNIRIKLQFQVDNKLVVMFGIVRTVELNRTENVSHLHFECTRIEPFMRNIILSYVYRMIPEEEKEILEAMRLTDGAANKNAYN